MLFVFVLKLTSEAEQRRAGVRRSFAIVCVRSASGICLHLSFLFLCCCRSFLLLPRLVRHSDMRVCVRDVRLARHIEIVHRAQQQRAQSGQSIGGGQSCAGGSKQNTSMEKA